MILCFACGIFGDVWILGWKLYSSGSGRNGSVVVDGCVMCRGLVSITHL